jgi:NADH-quinone oxidoreductase subunit L
MEGPTPVSALIHAATMVTAGVYMVFRAFPFYEGSEAAAIIVALVGTFTAFMAATIAITQNDIKRIVAYSTLSQLGYMVAALGVAAYVAAEFHLLTHAFFKGLLFLGCGAVIHGMHEEQNIQKMGNLRKYMPITFWTFLVASLANAGLFPLAGFWSKDEIIVGAWISDSNVGKLVAVVLLIAAFLTAFYMFRLVFLVFFTKERFDTEHVHPHDPPWSMKAPLMILAVPTVVIGLMIGWPPEEGPVHDFLEPVLAGESSHAEDEAARVAGQDVASLYAIQEGSPAAEGEGGATEDEHAEEGAAGAAIEEEHGAAGGHHVSETTLWTFGIISTLMAVGGIALAWATYLKGMIDPVAVARRYNGLYMFLLEKWRFDELYGRIFVQPLNRLSVVLWQVVDIGIIDATVNGVATGIGAISQRLRHVQTGLVANYALAIALGMVLLVGIYLTGFSNLFR